MLSGLVILNQANFSVAVQNHPCKFTIRSPDCEVFSEVRFSLQYEGQQIPLQFMDHENCICNNGIKDFMEVKLEKMVTNRRQDLGNF